MAYTTINKSTDYFNTITYTGNGTGSTARTVGFNPDWIWVKNRSSTDSHYLMDKLRGLDWNIETDTSAAQVRDYLISGTTSTGWTSSNSGEINANSANFVAWNWKANGQGSSNTTGSINTTYTSVNTTAGFSISTYTGNGVAGATIGHGLGVIPKMIIAKKLNGSPNWGVYHAGLGNASKYLELNTTAAEQTDSGVWDGATPTASVFYVGSDNKVNSSGDTYVAYCFAPKTGYSKFGSYTGNGNADGTFVYTGFKPAFVIIKRTDTTNNWYIHDNKRLGYNVSNSYLKANENSAESATTDIDILSNGFKCRSTGNGHNNSSGTYIYMAFGQSLVGSNNTPCTAR